MVDHEEKICEKCGEPKDRDLLLRPKPCKELCEDLEEELEEDHLMNKNIDILKSEGVEAVCLVREFFKGDSEKTALWFNTHNPNFGTSPLSMLLFRPEKLLKWIQISKAVG